MKQLFIYALLLCSMLSSGCNRHPTEIWDDTKTCGRHINRGLNTLCGQYQPSRQVGSREEFIGWNEDASCSAGYQEEFISMPGEQPCNAIAMADYSFQQPQETPGDPGSSIPGIDAFKDPSTIPHLRNVFCNVNFEYNSNLVKGDVNMGAIHTVANYLKNHPNVYVFVEGHCDERGPEAYNLALGSRRSNAVRSMLLDEGVNPDHVFTISYGAERPLSMESHEYAWGQNRRVEFKIYQQ